MKNPILQLVLIISMPLALLPSRSASAQRFAQPPANAPTEAEKREILTKMERLERAVASLRRKGVPDPMLADIEVHFKAAAWIVRFNEFYDKAAARWTVEALNNGLLRASQMASGDAPWLQQTGHTVVHAYRSRIDRSLQPYAVTLPKEYGKDRSKQWRIDVVLHGRNSKLTEVSFLHKHNGEREAPKQEFVQIDVYGRGNNAYRWAGEMDVLEALENFLSVERALGRDGMLDVSRVVLRGFSMGGAGTWHLGLHAPDRWAAIGPGAGFTRTHGYVKDLPDKLPDYQEKCLRIYDAIEYAENAFHVPVVAYAGSEDKQLQAARNIEEKLKGTKIPMTLLIGKGLAHKFPAEWQAKAEAEYRKHLAKERVDYPKRVRFVTYTMKYSNCAWVEILGLDEHYKRALVDAEQTADGFKIKTENVRLLHLKLEPGITLPTATADIDGEKIQARPYLSGEGDLHLYLERRDGKWDVVLPERVLTDRYRILQKNQNLQGPIDDAFMGAFLCVIGTGKPWHAATEKHAQLNLQRFQLEWSKYLRGEIPIKKDVEVTPADLASKHLILFGDPGSNSLIKQVVSMLPLTWTDKEIALAGTKVDASNHVPVMIYPSPLNVGQYVVLNSGHTFHAKDFQGTNALLFPRLGDYALLKLTGDEKNPLATSVVEAGLFDDFWRLSAK